MLRLLARTAVLLLAVAVGLLLTDWAFAALGWETFEIVWSNPLAFVVAVVVFAVAQAVLTPFFAKVARNNAPAMLSAVGLVTTYVALLIAVLVAPDGLEISGWPGWLVGPIIVWIVTLLANFLLPALLLKNAVEKRREGADG
ncbi:hypothetical protein GCM10009718_14720 [Isoptericola halotolerans]|uniref:Uncharacterized protein YacL n=1 Tax=Isoptericola halotolerans TaxID=300560 RepID=A0ABX1ZZ71_9MICO|nr:hypothetical protein [Isoptericola halotolerans]NOV95606.1 uncharacterized protein YacL [Isoptericola halotolerans]